MSKDFFSRIHLHITWHTKRSYPALVGNLESLAHQFIRERVERTPGVLFHEIGGIETHTHLAAMIPPTLRISEWIGQLKGGSAHDVNQRIAAATKPLRWQRGYGVTTFTESDLARVVSYIQNQRDHHRHGATVDCWEIETAAVS